MAFAPGYAISQVSQCFTVVLVAFLGFFLFTKTAWCDATVGRITKSRCDTIKRVIFGAAVALIALSFVAGAGLGGGGGYGGGYGGGMW